MAVKRIGFVSIILLVYSLLISSWVGTRTAPEVFADLLITLTRYGGSLAQQSLWIQFLVLFSSFLVSSILFLWVIQKKSHQKWIFISLILSGLIGLAQTIYLFTQGLRLSGVIIACLGFLGFISAGLIELSSQPLERHDARKKIAETWQKRLLDARDKNIPVSLLSAWSEKKPDLDVVQKLITDLRSDDSVTIILDGLYILLWDTPLKNAVTASQKTLKFLEHHGYDGVQFGIAAFPEDGSNLDELLDKADFSQQISRQNPNTAITTYREMIIPAEIDALLPEVTAQTTDFMLRLSGAWEEAQENQQPLSAIDFELAGTKENELSFTDLLKPWLRGKDQVGTLLPGHVLALLNNTHAEGCSQLTKKLQAQLLDKKPDLSSIKITPVLKISLEDNFEEFIKTLLCAG